MTEPRNIEMDKATLERAKGYGGLTGFAFPALEYYITQYEAQQARIAELERELEFRKPPETINMQEHDKALENLFTDLYGASYD